MHIINSVRPPHESDFTFNYLSFESDVKRQLSNCGYVSCDGAVRGSDEADNNNNGWAGEISSIVAINV